MNWYKQQLDKIADDCFVSNVPSSAKIKRDIDGALEIDIPLKTASKIRNLLKNANLSKRATRNINKIEEFIEAAYVEQIKGILRSYFSN